jgi:hypothetical protein
VGIRQTLNENPAITAGATGAIIVLAIIFIIVEMHGPRRTVGAPGKLFFTDDDGKTWFTDTATKIPPYTDDKGKEAVLCYVYKCGQNGQEFVGYMLKYTPEGQDRMQKALGPPNGPMMDIPPTAFTDTVVKKPGDPDWVNRTQGGDTYNNVMKITCPDGGTDIYPVNPNPEP